jgi:hypothetical protein|tara:strand:+ start:926 stop:1489 length:564 start_codon:yes stop_codon:yes gene_type:complete
MAKRTRRVSTDNEYKYRTIRRGSANSLILDEVWEQQLKTHLGEGYRNEKETEATMELTGLLDVFKRNYKFMATREDYRRMISLSQRARWDKKGLTKEDAMASLFVDGNPRHIRLGSRPNDLVAKSTKGYVPRPGSSHGKISTKQIGAQRVVKDFKKLLLTIFSIGNGKGAKIPKMNVERTISKNLKG